MTVISRALVTIRRAEAFCHQALMAGWYTLRQPRDMFPFVGTLACFALYVGHLQEVRSTDPNDAAGLVISDQLLVSRMFAWLPVDPAFFSGPIFVSLIFLVFIAALIFVTHTRTRNNRLAAILVALQIMIGVLVNNDLLLIVAAQLPLIFRLPQALLWMLMQSIGIMAAWTFVLITADFSESSGTRGLSWNDYATLVAISMLMFIAWQSFAFCLGYIAMSERKGRNRLAVANAQLRATRQLLAESERSDERLRIARELHDRLGHHLTALRIHLELASRQGSDQKSASVQTAANIASELLAEVRAVVSSEREEYPVDLKQSLLTMCDGLPLIDVTLDFDDDCRFSNTAQAHVAFRCIQEAVSNTLRHADATCMSINIRRITDGMQVTVTDNGRGVGEITAGNGLTGMRERIEAAGGHLTIDSDIGKGFKVTFWVPRHEERPND